MVARRSPKPIRRHPARPAAPVVHPDRCERTGLHRPIRHGRAGRGAAGVHRRGNQRGGTLGRSLLLPAIRRLRILRPRPQRPHAGRFAGSGMDADAIRHDRRSEGRRGIGAYRRAGKKFGRALAHRRGFGTAGRAGNRRRRAAFLRERGRRTHQRSGLRVAAHEPQQLREPLSR